MGEDVGEDAPNTLGGRVGVVFRVLREDLEDVFRAMVRVRVSRGGP